MVQITLARTLISIVIGCSGGNLLAACLFDRPVKKSDFYILIGAIVLQSVAEIIQSIVIV